MKNLRRVLQWTAFLIFLTGFLPFIPAWAGKPSETLINMQFFPALFRMTVIPVIILVITLIFGRIYCSTICPLATVQDVFISRKRRFSFRKLRVWKRYLIPALSLSALIAGLPALASVTDPYSVSGRIISTLNEVIIIPLIDFAALILRNLSVYITSYPFNFRWVTIITTLISLGIIMFMSRFGGRLYCNTICPVGALLSIPARFAVFSHRINPDKCTSCGACERVCKAEAIDSKAKLLDDSKCISCFNCNSVCNFDALKYGRKEKKTKAPKDSDVEKNSGRRDFLKKGAAGSLLLIAAPLGARPFKVSAAGFDNSTAAVPPGSSNRRDFLSKCTTCSLCISRCPGKVLQPASFKQYGLTAPGVPYMDYNKGFCDFDCNLCTRLCPSSAIKPLELSVKQRVKIGESKFVLDFCVVETDGTSCGACGEICPSGAIDMVHFGKGADGDLEIPEIDKTYCIGCGACQFVCPVVAKNAIFVEALAEHGRAEVRKNRELTPTEETDNDFAF